MGKNPEIRCVCLLWVSKGRGQHTYWILAVDAVVRCPDSSSGLRNSLPSCQGHALPESCLALPRGYVHPLTVDEGLQRPSPLISTGLNSIQKATPTPEELIGTAEAFATTTLQFSFFPCPILLPSLPESTPNQPPAY